MNAYLPESLQQIHLPLSTEMLHHAAQSGDILQAPVVLCDEKHDLYVDLGGTTGRIARSEAAIGICEGTTRDIAILTLVGKSICFQVLGFGEKQIPILSRRAAQETALAHLLALPVGAVLQAVVTHCTAFGAFCDIGCGVPALLGRSEICTAHLRHAGEILSVGQKLRVRIARIDRAQRRIFLTLAPMLGTWEQNASLFRQGQTVPGIVRGIMDYGIFVDLTPNLSGLADAYPNVAYGDGVSVYIKSIYPERHKLKLSIVQRLETPPTLPLRYFPSEEAFVSRPDAMSF